MRKRKKEERTNSIIGPGAEFKGNLKDKEGIRVDGRFEGEIETEGIVTIGEDAGVQANIKAAALIIAGKVVGDIECGGKVEICSTGSLEGKVKASDLAIAEGAFFNGECRMNLPSQRVEVEEDFTEEQQ